jgi:DNA-binding NarL/FixJ family response regulator
VKILIVDDHPIVRAGLRRLLAAEPATKVEEVASGKAALAVSGKGARISSSSI